MKKTYTFRFLYAGEDDFVRDIEIASGQTLLDLHHGIQENLGFDPAQMASFFLTDDTWEKGEEIPLIDMSGEIGDRIMENTVIDENSIENYDRLLYIFDYLSNRGFFIEMVRTGEVTRGTTYPRCTRAEGSPPEQMVLDPDFNFLDDDFSGDDSEDISFESLDDLPDL